MLSVNKLSFDAYGARHLSLQHVHIINNCIPFLCTQAFLFYYPAQLILNIFITIY